MPETLAEVRDVLKHLEQNDIRAQEQMKALEHRVAAVEAWLKWATTILGSLILGSILVPLLRG